MVSTIIFTCMGTSLLVSAYYSELVYINRANKLEASEPFSANLTWQLTKMAEQSYHSSRYIVLGYQLSKKTVHKFASLIILLIALAQLFITVPIEMPYLLSIVLGAYLWTGTSCRILRVLLCKYKMSLGQSLTYAIALPPCIFALLYLVFMQLQPYYTRFV